MEERDYSEFSGFLEVILSLSSGDRHFISDLILELGKRAPASSASVVRKQILEVTREIAPERVESVARCLELCKETTSGVQ